MKTNFKMTDNNKDVVCKCFDDFINNQYLRSGRSSVFDILEANKVLILSDSAKIKYYEQARKILLEIDSKKPERERKPNFYAGNRSHVITIKAKVLVLESYFAKINASGKHLKELLK